MAKILKDLEDTMGVCAFMLTGFRRLDGSVVTAKFKTAAAKKYTDAHPDFRKLSLYKQWVNYVGEELGEQDVFFHLALTKWFPEANDEDGEGVGGNVPAPKTSKDAMSYHEDGYPLVPEYDEEDLDGMKKVVRQYFTAAYSKFFHDQSCEEISQSPL